MQQRIFLIDLSTKVSIEKSKLETGMPTSEEASNILRQINICP